MEMRSEKRSLDKIYARRGRYEIPDWQRGKVWDKKLQQNLIDSILRGWKLPKFYFVKKSNDSDQYEVVDGQQRLQAIWRFFGNELEIPMDSPTQMGGKLYKELPTAIADKFDDFEIEYDVITGAIESDLKEFFQRLQLGLPLTSSERLNAIHSELRDFALDVSKHSFFKSKCQVEDYRHSHLDIAAKACAIEIKGITTGLRFDDLKLIFENNSTFSRKSAVAKRITSTLAFLDKSFPAPSPALHNRTIVQSIFTLAATLVSAGKAVGHETVFSSFAEAFTEELSKQVELGVKATDRDYLEFQKTINANIKSGPEARQRILTKKLLTKNPELASAFGATAIAKTTPKADVLAKAEQIAELIEQINTKSQSATGKDLFKPTNKTLKAQRSLGVLISDVAEYEKLIDNLYFLLWEGPGERLGESPPSSFIDVNTLRTEIRHDVDHGKGNKVAVKRRKHADVFKRLSGAASPQGLNPDQFAIFHLKILSEIENDLRAMLHASPSLTPTHLAAQPANASAQVPQQKEGVPPIDTPVGE
ncbi:DUF262 domain-containing protein [Corallococcus exiguus]|uniref:DUF262 domain-containing protein n=1 Tax=Corallococcus exiguus TaxID=83462 RepID=A0A7X5BT16_9BACT|nr:DUF262 domain-containing protein [Corallococcus exiguus]NBC39767.1 DUF262 domain-containing protein [Corallococcus exiguus]TNV66820.1 DUF262 domain-containing protein [Corallococcus exiguus]